MAVAAALVAVALAAAVVQVTYTGQHAGVAAHVATVRALHLLCTHETPLEKLNLGKINFIQQAAQTPAISLDFSQQTQGLLRAAMAATAATELSGAKT